MRERKIGYLDAKSIVSRGCAWRITIYHGGDITGRSWCSLDYHLHSLQIMILARWIRSLFVAYQLNSKTDVVRIPMEVYSNGSPDDKSNPSADDDGEQNNEWGVIASA